jgi:cytochrome b6-f complex iron-sulfur subunit
MGRRRGRGMSRRDFFRTSWLASMGVTVAGFTGASLGFLWPTLRGGFGAKINLGQLDALKTELATLPGNLKYFPEARTYLASYAGTGADTTYRGFVVDGLIASYQKCAHLGCRVPFCETSSWFECPCHGSQYNRVGEYKSGPAPAGLWHFPITVDGGNVIVDTAAPGAQAPRGTDTIGQEPAGPHCV